HDQHDVTGGSSAGVVGAGHLAAGLVGDLHRRSLGLLRATRTDYDGEPGLGETTGEALALRAGAAKHSDGLVRQVDLGHGCCLNLLGSVVLTEASHRRPRGADAGPATGHDPRDSGLST